LLDRQRRDGIEYPIWSAVHGLAVLTGQGPLREAPAATRRHVEELTHAFIGQSLALADASLAPTTTTDAHLDQIPPRR